MALRFFGKLKAFKVKAIALKYIKIIKISKKGHQQLWVFFQGAPAPWKSVFEAMDSNFLQHGASAEFWIVCC